MNLKYPASLPAYPTKYAPYSEPFDTNGNWSVFATQSPSWVFGTPAKRTLNKCHSGNTCWVLGGLTGNYSASEKSWIRSPPFNFMNVVNPLKFYFWMNRLMETGYDGMKLEYSLNEGTTWISIGDVSSNWYDSDSVQYLSNTPGWTGTDSGWKYYYTLLPQAISQSPRVFFRFYFGCGSTVHDQGALIDDIVISERNFQRISIKFPTDFHRIFERFD